MKKYIIVKIVCYSQLKRKYDVDIYKTMNNTLEKIVDCFLNTWNKTNIHSQARYPT